METSLSDALEIILGASKNLENAQEDLIELMKHKEESDPEEFTEKIENISERIKVEKDKLEQLEPLFDNRSK